MKLNPALAVFYTNTDKLTEALRLWRALNDADRQEQTKWAFEASFTLQLVKQTRVLDENLAWIKARSIQAAVNALLYPSVDVGYARNWIANNCPNYLIKFYDFIVQQTGQNKPKRKLVEEALLAFCQLLQQMESSDFQVNLVTYNEDAERASPGRHPDMLPGLRKEAAEKIADILKNFAAGHAIDLEPFVSLVSEAKERALFLKFCSIGEMYERATEVLCGGRLDIDELETFCRTAPNSEKAFSLAFHRMKNDGRDLLADGADFLIRNLEWISMAEILDWLPEDMPLNSASHILESAVALLIEKERLLRLESGVVQSMNLDVDYRLVSVEKKSVRIQSGTLCEAGGRPVGNGWVALAPDDRVYHITCKPRLSGE
jgi:hypothetical protein